MVKERSDDAACASAKQLQDLEDEAQKTKAAHEQAMLRHVEQANQTERQLEVQLHHMAR